MLRYKYDFFSMTSDQVGEVRHLRTPADTTSGALSGPTSPVANRMSASEYFR
jgi:hypothetical protein